MDIEPTANLCAMITCTQDGAGKLASTLNLFADLSLPLIIVDSSSCGDGECVADSINPSSCPARAGCPCHDVQFVAAPRRRALQAAFAAAKKLGCTHAIVFEAGCEFPVGNLAALLKSSGENPSALILACPADLPPRRFFGGLSDLLVRLESGLRLHDAPCSPRIYPLRLIDMISRAGKRNPGRMEILVRAAWVGCPIIVAPVPSPVDAPVPSAVEAPVPSAVEAPVPSAVEAPVPSAVEATLRPPWAPRPAHRSYLGATRYMLRQAFTHVRLLARALSGWPHPKYAAGASPARPPLWPSVWQWCNPLRAWRELRQGGAAGRGEMAAGIAVGVFIANTPAYGFQTVLAFYAARRLHLHPVAVVAGSKASTPPIGPVLIAAAVCVGHILLHGARPQWKNITPFDGRFFANAGPILLDWLLGSLVVGTVTAIAAFIAASFLFRFVERGKPQTDSAAGANGKTSPARASPATQKEFTTEARKH